MKNNGRSAYPETKDFQRFAICTTIRLPDTWANTANTLARAARLYYWMYLKWACSPT